MDWIGGNRASLSSLAGQSLTVLPSASRVFSACTVKQVSSCEQDLFFYQRLAVSREHLDSPDRFHSLRSVHDRLLREAAVRPVPHRFGDRREVDLPLLLHRRHPLPWALLPLPHPLLPQVKFLKTAPIKVVPDYDFGSEHVSKLFCKLDYVGISLLTVGSFVPWIYYGFYCQYTPKVRSY